MKIAALEASVRAYAARVRTAVACDVAFVFGVEKSGNMLVAVAQDGAYDGFPMPIVHPEQGFTGQAFSFGRYFASDEYRRLAYRRVRGVVLGTRSIFALPLVLDGRTYGAVACVSREPAAYELRERELTRVFASIEAIACDAIELLAEMHFQQKRFHALQTLVRANAERLPLDAACAMLSEVASEAVGADYVVVGRRTEAGTTTYHGPFGVTSGTWSQGMLSYTPLAIGFETAVESGETVVIDLASVADDDEAFVQSKAEGAKTLVIVPIAARGSRIGTLLVGWRFRIQPPKRVLDLLATIASQASVAVTDEWRKDDALLRADLEIARATNRSAAADLRATLAADELELVYQPIFDLRTGAIVECEALARWPGAPTPFENPELFVRLAEEYGTIGLLTDRVFYRALRDLPTLPSDVRIAINISMVNLLQIEFAKRLLRILAVANVSPSRFVIELTETATIVDRELGSEAVAELARAGVGISIDDFGEGYSALSYLKMFSATTIKIHKRYVHNVRADSFDDAIVRSIVELAHRLDMVVVAEGVEEPGVLDALRAIGCDRVQGFGLARPMTIDEMRVFLASPQTNISAIGDQGPAGRPIAPSA